MGGAGNGPFERKIARSQVIEGNRRVIFTTAEALLPQDHNEVEDVYEWTESGGLALVDAGVPGLPGDSSGRPRMAARSSSSPRRRCCRATATGANSTSTRPGLAAVCRNRPNPPRPAAGFDARQGLAASSRAPAPGDADLGHGSNRADRRQPPAATGTHRGDDAAGRSAGGREARPSSAGGPGNRPVAAGSARTKGPGPLTVKLRLRPPPAVPWPGPAPAPAPLPLPREVS